MTNERPRPFERRWTPEQAAAIAYHAIDAKPRMSAAKAAAAGARGELTDGKGNRLEPFGNPQEDGTLAPMPTATAQDIIRRERNARAVQARGRLARAGDTETALRMVLSDAWDGLDAVRKRLYKANSNMSASDAAKAWRDLAKAAEDLHRIERNIAPPELPRKRNEQPSTAKQPADKDAAALTKAARARARTEHRDTLPTTATAAQPTGSTPQQQAARTTDSVARERTNGSAMGDLRHNAPGLSAHLSRLGSVG